MLEKSGQKHHRRPYRKQRSYSTVLEEQYYADNAVLITISP